MTQTTVETRAAPDVQQRIADAITAFCGNMVFVYVHAVAFAVWIATDGFGKDDFPYSLLTMVVSLEAIFLSTFILISQNRQEAAAEARNDVIQQSMVKMLSQILSDEKIDQRNERLIQSLLQRIDVDHLRPMRDEIAQVAASVERIERAVARGG